MTFKLISATPLVQEYFDTRVPVQGSYKQPGAKIDEFRVNFNPMTKGMTTGAHQHDEPHTTIVFAGSVHVRAYVGDETLWEAEFTAPDYFSVPERVGHEITALEDNTLFWCLFSDVDRSTNTLRPHNNPYLTAYGKDQ